MGNPSNEPEREEREAAAVVAGVLGTVSASEYEDAEPATKVALRASALARLAAMATGCLATVRSWDELPRIRVLEGEASGTTGTEGQGDDAGEVLFDALAALIDEAVAEGELTEAEAAEIRGVAGDGTRILDLGAGSPRAFLAALAALDELGDEARGVPGVAVA